MTKNSTLTNKKQVSQTAELNEDAKSFLEAEFGNRDIKGLLLHLGFAISVSWSLIQLWTMSPLPLTFNFLVIDGVRMRFLHLTFAFLLTFLFFPAFITDNDKQKRKSILGVTLFSLISFLISISITIFLFESNLIKLQVSKNFMDLSFLQQFSVVFVSLLIFSVIFFSVFYNKFTKTLPIGDILLCLVAAYCSFYLLVLNDDIALRSGLPNLQDKTISVLGLLCLLEAGRRTVGSPIVIIASIFLIYTIFGPYFPGILAHGGTSISRLSSQQWLSTEGVFGIAIGVSSSFVFLFVLFGSLLDKAGAGSYFIKLAFALLGHLRGGPAKAAVFSSAITGIISGSSIANVVTTGTFTIPLMKKVGFSKEQSGAIEVASSVNGQVMPPVMGAAAFLMVEYLNLDYSVIIKHAFVPAVISYIALLYLVHIEAVKNNMKVLDKIHHTNKCLVILFTLITFVSIVLICALTYFIVTCIKILFPTMTLLPISIILLGIFISTLYLRYKSGVGDSFNNDTDLSNLPLAMETLKTGLHYFIPIFILIWCLMVEQMSPGYGALIASVSLIVLIMLQRVTICLFAKKYHNIGRKIIESFNDLLNSLSSGARNMISIALATAIAGIIVGTISQTGVGTKLADIVSILAGDSILLMLIATAFISIILGMGLPTTANYIVVSSLMTGVIMTVGQQNGLFVPIVVVHFFVFYFGLMADVTPPVGLASFAASAVSGGDPIKTSIQSFKYSIRSFILPFLFMYNNELLLVGVNGWLDSTAIFVKATFAIIIFVASVQRYFVTHNKLHETILLMIASMMAFLPNVFTDKLFPPYQAFNVQEVPSQSVQSLSSSDKIRLKLQGYDITGKEKSFYIEATMSEVEKEHSKPNNITELLRSIGCSVSKNVINNVKFNSFADKKGISNGTIVENIFLPLEQPNKNWFVLLSIIIVAGVFFVQKRRVRNG